MSNRKEAASTEDAAKICLRFDTDFAERLYRNAKSIFVADRTLVVEYASKTDVVFGVSRLAGDLRQQLLAQQISEVAYIEFWCEGEDFSYRTPVRI